MLDRRADALRRADKPAWMSTVASHAAAGYRERQASVYDHLRQLPVADYQADAVEQVKASSTESVQPQGPRSTSPPDRFVVKASVSYRLTGFGGQRHFTSYLTVASPSEAPARAQDLDRDRPGLVSDTDGPTQLQAWDLPGMHVERGRSSLVVGNVPIARLRAYAQMADHGVGVVNRIWGRDWGRTAVLVAPASEEELAGLLGDAHDTKGSDQVSAVTIGPVDGRGRVRASQVVIAPHTWDQLVPAGRQVVISHELTHVATGWSTTSAVPLWLSEGLAEYIAYAEVALSRRAVAAAVVERVRVGAGPTALPADDEFDPATHDIAVADNAAWLLCRSIVDAHGQHALIAFYRKAADTSASSDRGTRPHPQESVMAAATARHTAWALRESLGVSEDHLLHVWLSDLERLSHGPDVSLIDQ